MDVHWYIEKGSASYGKGRPGAVHSLSSWLSGGVRGEAIGISIYSILQDIHGTLRHHCNLNSLKL